MKYSYDYLDVKKLKAISDNILVVDMEFKERITSGGIILRNDDMKSVGIRPRWARVYSIGPEQKFVSPGQYVMVAHGRWSRGVKIRDENGEHVLRRVDPNDILLVSDEPVDDETISDKE